MPRLCKFRATRLQFALVFFACLAARAQTSVFRDLHVQKKPGQETGPAVVTVTRKIKRVVQHAVEAWPVMNGQNALILVRRKGKGDSGEYRLLFVEGTSRKRRDLGAVPFASAELKDLKLSDGTWAFVLNGNATEGPVLIVADTDGVHGRVSGAASVQAEADSVRYIDNRTGQTVTVSVPALLGMDMAGIYEVNATDFQKRDYVQFLRDGSAVLTDPHGQFLTGTWWTDGENMNMAVKNAQHLEWQRRSLIPVEGVPAGTRLTVRLLEPLSSNKVKEGDSIRAVLISPGAVDGKIFIPQGTEFSGTIMNAHGVGWALKHETAALTLEFDSARLTDGNTLAIHTKLYQVENSQEKVNDRGTIQGLRSTGTPGYSAESKIASVAALDPVAYLFSTSGATAALGFAEPEILYPAGTELEMEVAAPIVTSKTFPPSAPPLATSPDEERKPSGMVRALPFRTVTQTRNKPSDLTNLAFIGSSDALRRAFQAAGWVYTDQLTAGSTFQT